MKTSHAH